MEAILNNNGHTSGPWEMRESKGSQRGYFIEPCIAKVSGVGGPIANANARLISAAPDLLESLRELSSIVGNRLPIGAFTEAKAKALAALAKAEGR